MSGVEVKKEEDSVKDDSRFPVLINWVDSHLSSWIIYQDAEKGGARLKGKKIIHLNLTHSPSVKQIG